MKKQINKMNARDLAALTDDEVRALTREDINNMRSGAYVKQRVRPSSKCRLRIRVRELFPEIETAARNLLNAWLQHPKDPYAAVDQAWFEGFNTICLIELWTRCGEFVSDTSDEKATNVEFATGLVYRFTVPKFMESLKDSTDPDDNAFLMENPSTDNK